MRHSGPPQTRWEKVTRAALLGFGVEFLVMYLFGVYTSMEFNPWHWNAVWRAMHAYFALAAGLVAGVITHSKEGP